MQPGNIIALHNTELRRFVRMNGHNGRMDTSTPVSFDNLPANWEWEKFVVVDAGRGQIALHNTETNRFCRMSGSDMDSGNPTDVDKLNPKWAYEPFTVVSAWDGEIGLYNTHHKRFMRMEPGDMGISHDVAMDALSRDSNRWLVFKPKLVMTKAEADKAASGAEAKAEAEAAPPSMPKPWRSCSRATSSPCTTRN